MSHVHLWIGLALAVLVAASTTANVALRHFSRAHLAERLGARGRAALLDRLIDYRDDLIFCSSVIRVIAMLATVLLITHMAGAGPRQEPVRQYAIIFAASMLVLLVVGVAIPHACARYAGESFLIAALPLLIALRQAVRPLLALEHAADGLVRRLAGVPPTDRNQTGAHEIEKEILTVVSEGEMAGTVHEEDADMIASVIEFRDKDVAQIMTPRTQIVALPATATLLEAKETIVHEGHSRIPVYGQNIDDILGVLYAKDLLSCDERAPFDPTDVMRKVPFVPETKLIPHLLAEMREKKVHLAIVVDEYGGTAGLVTIEDIIEEIVGEISDEYEAAQPAPIRRLDERTVEVDARVRIDELNEELNIRLPEDRDYDTVGGFLFSEMGKVPAAGEEWRHQNVRLRVLDAEARKINRIRVQVMTEEKPA